MSASLQREFLEREASARKEQAEAAAEKRRALQDRVARRKHQSGRAIPAAVQNANASDVEALLLAEPLAIRPALVEDLLFDPNLDKEQARFLFVIHCCRNLRVGHCRASPARPPSGDAHCSRRGRRERTKARATRASEEDSSGFPADSVASLPILPLFPRLCCLAVLRGPVALFCVRCVWAMSRWSLRCSGRWTRT